MPSSFDFDEFIDFTKFVEVLGVSSVFAEEFKKGFRTHGRQYVRQLISERTRGRPGLKRRTGNLARSITPRVTGRTVRDLTLSVTIGEGLAYAKLQEEGGTIRPKRARNLAIPLDSVRTPAGVPRFKPRDSQLQPMFAVRLRGKLFLAKRFKNRTEARSVLGRGPKLFIDRRTVLLFVLKKSVKVPGRLGAKELFTREDVSNRRDGIMRRALNRALRRLGTQ